MDRRQDFSLSELIAAAPKTRHYRQKIHDALRSYFQSKGRVIVDKKHINSSLNKNKAKRYRIDWAAIYDDLVNNDEFSSFVSSPKEWQTNLIDNSSSSPPDGHNKYHMCLLYWMHLPVHLIYETQELNLIGDRVSFEIFKVTAAEKDRADT